MKYKIELVGEDSDIICLYRLLLGKWHKFRYYNLSRDGRGYVKMSEGHNELSHVICKDGRLRLTGTYYINDLDGNRIVLSGGLPSLISLISHDYGIAI